MSSQSLADTFECDGYARVDAVLPQGECTQLAASLSSQPGAGSRCLLDLDACAALVPRLRAHAGLSVLIPAGHVAVQCTYFEKSAATNWLVPVHQDLSVPVRGVVVDPTLSGWSRKDDMHFVQPPLNVLQALVAVRLHLDVCGIDDGPLRVVPGSHRHGRIPADATTTLRDALGEKDCLVAAGDALVLRPLLLHASSKARGTSQRRVLHFVFGPPTLPCGLAWHQAL